MTSARELRIETNFTRRTRIGKGVGLHEAIARADQRLEAMRDKINVAVDQMLSNIEAQRKSVILGNTEACLNIRAQCDSVVGLARFSGIDAIGEVALSLCKLFDICSPRLPDSQSLCVHLDALLVLRFAAPNDSAVSTLLEGLRQVVLAVQPTGQAQPRN